MEAGKRMEDRKERSVAKHSETQENIKIKEER